MSPEGKKASIRLTPVSQKLVDLIERNADELTNSWLADIRKDPNTLDLSSFRPERGLYPGVPGLQPSREMDLARDFQGGSGQGLSGAWERNAAAKDSPSPR